MGGLLYSVDLSLVCMCMQCKRMEICRYFLSFTHFFSLSFVLSVNCRRIRCLRICDIHNNREYGCVCNKMHNVKVKRNIQKSFCHFFSRSFFLYIHSLSLSVFLLLSPSLCIFSRKQYIHMNCTSPQNTQIGSCKGV